MALARPVVGWLPTGLLIFFGVLYFAQCVSAALAPGRPLEIIYEGSGGNVEFTAKSYVIDPVTRRINLFDARVNLVGEQSSVFVKKIGVAQRDGGFDIAVSGLEAALTRREDGALSALDLLPKAGDGEGPSFTIELRDGVVDYRDLTGESVVERRARLDDVLVESNGAGVVGKGAFELAESGKGSVAFLIGDDGRSRWDVVTPGLDLVDLREVAERWLPEDAVLSFDDFRARGAFYVGSVGVDVGEELEIAASYKGSLLLEGVDAPDLLVGAKGSLALEGTEKFLRLSGMLSEAGRSVDVTGGVSFGDDIRFVGDVRATVANRGRIWRALDGVLPKEIGFIGGEWQGSVVADLEGAEADGVFAARSATWNGEQLTGLKLRTAVGREKVGLEIQEGRWKGANVEGWIGIDLKQSLISGWVDVPGAETQKVLDAFEVEGVLLDGGVRALVSGRLASPEVDFGYDGSLSLITEAKRFDFGQVVARGQLVGSDFELTKGFVAGDYGEIAITGWVRDFGKTLDLNWQAGQLDLSSVQAEWKGSGLAVGSVTGSVERPIVDGTLQLYDMLVANVSIAQTQALVRYVDGVVSWEGLDARIGLGQIIGAGTWTVEGGSLSGTFSATDLYLTDFQELPVFGGIAVPSLELSGTLENPLFTGVAVADEISAYEVQADEVVVLFNGNKDGVTVEEIAGTVGGGDLTGSGLYSWKEQTGSGKLDLSKISLESLPLDRSQYDVRGEVSGTVVYAKTKDGQEGKVEGEIDDLSANGYYLGSGKMQGDLEGMMITGSASVGSLEGFVEVKDVFYNLELNDFGGDLLANGLELSGVWRAVGDDLEKLDEKTRELLDTFSGKLTGSIGVLVDDAGVKWEVDLATVSEMSLGGVDVGELSARGGTGIGDSGRLESLVWKTENGEMRAEGAIDPVGKLDGKVQFDSVELGLIARAFGVDSVWAASLDGAVDFSGSKDSPEGSGKLLVSRVRQEGVDGENLPLTLDLNEVYLKGDLLSGVGRLNYENFGATVEAALPFGAMKKGSEDLAKVRVKSDDFAVEEFKKFMPFLDFEKSRGIVAGDISLEGNVESWNLLGGIGVSGVEGERGAVLALAGVDTTFDEVEVAVTTQGKKAVLQGEARSVLGGFAEISGEVSLADLLVSDSGDVGREVPVVGKISFDEFRLRQILSFDLKGGKVSRATAPTEGTLTGEVTIGGNLEAPRIGGRVEASGLELNLPGEFPEGSPSGEVGWKGRFENLTLVVLPGSRVNLPIGSISMFGTGTVEGGLGDLLVSAPLTVESGEFSLASTRVVLEEGGRVNAQFDTLTGDSRVDINLEGTTRATVRRGQDRFESYRIQLNMVGDLLRPDGVQLTGSSDPPGLSNEDIRAVIGQRELIESLAGQVLGGGGSGLRDGFYSFAIPTLTQRFTQEIAKQLGLDYLILDYNPFDQGIIRAGKRIGFGLNLEGSRQIQAPEFGRLKYDLRLSYQVPSRDRILNRFRFTFGLDESVAWRFGVDWSIRF